MAIENKQFNSDYGRLYKNLTKQYQFIEYLTELELMLKGLLIYMCVKYGKHYISIYRININTFIRP